MAWYFLQEDRERIIVRRHKFEEPRLELIQDLEVYIPSFSPVYIIIFFLFWALMLGCGSIMKYSYLLPLLDVTADRPSEVL